MAKKTFRVYPNPFLYIDHDGYPAGVCHCDMLEHVGLVRKWVGARLDPANTHVLEQLSKEELRYRDPRQQTRFTYDFSEPTQLLMTEYYRDRLRDGEIFAADKATHLLAGFPADTYVEPKQALAKAKALALRDWAAHRGPDEKPDGIDVLDQAIAALGGPAAAPAESPAPSGDSQPKKSSKGA